MQPSNQNSLKEKRVKMEVKSQLKGEIILRMKKESLLKMTLNERLYQ
jgi:hypothetical protein